LCYLYEQHDREGKQYKPGKPDFFDIGNVLKFFEVPTSQCSTERPYPTSKNEINEYTTFMNMMRIVE
jgi:hypothetical protein